MAKTPFERNFLPRFASWFLNTLDQDNPDFFIPVERKGAHLLDTVLAYLRFDLGVPVRTQVLYKRALFFTNPAEMLGKKALILDDATRSGRTLRRYNEVVKACGNPAVKMMACIGASSLGEAPSKGLRDDVQCFVELPPNLYREYLQQIAELVVSRGLPPEADHHMFSITPLGSLARFWDSLLDRLSIEGKLDVRGPVSGDRTIHGATLHFPQFLPQDLLPEKGPIQGEGVIKFKLFADFARDFILVIPMIYPQLNISSTASKRNMDTIDCRSLYNAWGHDCSNVGRALIDHTYPHADPFEILYHAVSISCEAKMVRRLATILAESSLAQDVASFTCERETFCRLYGPRLGLQLVNAINQEITFALQESSAVPMSDIETNRVDRVQKTGLLETTQSVKQVNASVNEATDSLLLFLKSSYYDKNRGKPDDAWESVGYCFSDLQKREPFASQAGGSLLLSRCVDFGCSITSLVPYLSVDLASANNAYTVTRKYRTAESVDETDGRIEDMRTYRKETATETVAAVTYFLKRRSRRWKNSSIPQFVLYKVLAIINAAMPEIDKTALVIIPLEHGPEAAYELPAYAGPPDLVLIPNLISENYAITRKGEVEVTPAFEERYREGSLHLSHRQSLIAIESYLGALTPLLDDASNVDDLLIRWAILANGRLGLDYAMVDVGLALDSLMKPLEVLSGGRPLDKRKLAKSQSQAHHRAGVARKEKIEKLIGDWSQLSRPKWDAPIKVESDLLASFLVPIEGQVLFEVAKAFCLVVTRFADLMGQLTPWTNDSSSQIDLFTNDSSGRTKAAAPDVMRKLHDLEVRLRTMRGDSSYDHIPDTSPQQEMAIGRKMKRFLQILERFAGAYAWKYSPLMRWGAASLPDPAPRNRVILFADIAGSTPKALTLEQQHNVQWKNNGLNLIAQWGQAFGGYETTDIYPRKGDDICIEFTDPDSAVLCAAMIQEHACALRSTGSPNLDYRFRMAVDSYWLNEADGRNTISLCIDRAAKLAKAERERSILDPVWITPEVAGDSSEEIRSSLSLYSKEIDLGAETSRSRFTPSLLNRRGLLSVYIARLSAYADMACKSRDSNKT